MATKRYYATGAFRYQTRMLTAGDPVELDGPNARLFTALGKVSPDKPRTVRPTPPVIATLTATTDEVGQVASVVPPSSAPITTPASPKIARKRKAAAKR